MQNLALGAHGAPGASQRASSALRSRWPAPPRSSRPACAPRTAHRRHQQRPALPLTPGGLTVVRRGLPCRATRGAREGCPMSSFSPQHSRELGASPPPARRALVSGATGFIGGRLAQALADAGWTVRCLVRDRSRARDLERRGFEIHEGDVLRPETLDEAGRDVEIAYYLIHAMGRGARGDFARREHAGAEAFAQMALREGIARAIYLGGLGEPHSRHLRSRHETARLLAEHGPPCTYFRAGMVVGAGSESYRTLRYLVERLPAMIAPAWLKVPTQPIAIDDVLAYLTAAPDLPESAGREIQIGGPDVLPYGEMLDRMAAALGRRPRPKLPVPLLTPRLSSLWIGLVTPVDAGVARPLIEGLSTKTIVTDTSGAKLFDITPLAFEDALERAVADDSATVSTRGTARRRVNCSAAARPRRTTPSDGHSASPSSSRPADRATKGHERDPDRRVRLPSGRARTRDSAGDHPISGARRWGSVSSGRRAEITPPPCGTGPTRSWASCAKRTSRASCSTSARRAAASNASAWGRRRPAAIAAGAGRLRPGARRRHAWLGDRGGGPSWRSSASARGSASERPTTAGAAPAAQALSAALASKAAARRPPR